MITYAAKKRLHMRNIPICDYKRPYMSKLSANFLICGHITVVDIFEFADFFRTCGFFRICEQFSDYMYADEKVSYFPQMQTFSAAYMGRICDRPNFA